MEKRNRQNLNLSKGTQPMHGNGVIEHNGETFTQVNAFPNWKERISLAAQDKERVFHNLLTHFNVETLREAFQAQSANKALGIDGVSKEDYGKNLEANLMNLADRIHRGSYKPQKKREVLIPKANGKTRPIAISCFEDKLVEWVTGKILELVYEPLFIRNSFGFRPNKSAHGAIQATYQSLEKNQRPHVVEIDLASFFNSIPHGKLMKVIGKRISDKRFKGLIGRFLEVGVLEQSGETTEPDAGTPQGSIMSPVLANVYLNEVLDQWFVKEFGSYNNIIVRYADDAVFFFKKEETANHFVEALEKRIEEYGLALNRDKTGVIRFSRYENHAFSFLNFTFYWDKKRSNGVRHLRIKTKKETLHRKIQEFYDWIKSERNKMETKELWELAKVKIKGHYNYYGFWMNQQKLNHFYHEASRSMFKWLNRRSQKTSYLWVDFQRKLAFNPLPVPPPIHQLKQLGRNPYAKV